MNEYGALVQR